MGGVTRSLDRRVAEVVMGWKNISSADFELNGFVLSPEGVVNRQFANGSARPFFPTIEISDAWLVVERMRELGWGYRCLRHSKKASGKGKSVEWTFMKSGEGDRSISTAEHESDATVICLAALKALGHEREGA